MLLFFVYIGLLAFAMLIAQVYVCRGICMHRYMYAQVHVCTGPLAPPQPSTRATLQVCCGPPSPGLWPASERGGEKEEGEKERGGGGERGGRCGVTEDVRRARQIWGCLYSVDARVDFTVAEKRDSEYTVL